MKNTADATCQVDKIMDYLRDIAIHNDRSWFWEHRERYDEVMELFHAIVVQLILRIGEFDVSVRHLQVKDCTYRFFRDVRFSQDKYICMSIRTGGNDLSKLSFVLQSLNIPSCYFYTHSIITVPYAL